MARPTFHRRWWTRARSLSSSVQTQEFKAYFYMSRWAADTTRLDDLRKAANLQRASAEASKGLRLLRGMSLLNAARTQLALAVYTDDTDLARDAVALARSGAEQTRWLRPLVQLGLAQLLFILHWITSEPDVADEGAAIWRTVNARNNLWRAVAVAAVAPAVLVTAEQAGDAALFQEVVASCRADLAGARLRRRSRREYLATICANLAGTFTFSYDVDFMRELIDLQRRSLARRTAARVRVRVRRREADRRQCLARCLRSQFSRTGDPAALAESISLLRTSVAATPAGDPDAAVRLARLGSVLLAEYQSTGELVVLAEAVAVGRAAQEAGPKENAASLVLSCLADSLETLSARTGDLGALREAIAAYRGAAAAAEQGEPNHVMNLSDLASALSDLSTRTRDDATALEACDVAQAAVDAAPVGSRARAQALNILGITLSSPRVPPDRRGEASAAFRAALDALQSGSTSQAIMTNLGAALWQAARDGGSADDLAEARTLLAQAAAATDEPIDNRISTLRSLARAEQTAGDHAAATEAITRAVGLLAFAAPPQVRRADRAFRLGGHSGIAEQAAACALTAGRPGHAVTLLEQARGIALADLMGQRSVVTSLRSSAPDLADRLERAAQRVARLESASTNQADQSMIPLPRNGFSAAALPMLPPRTRRALDWRRAQEHARRIDAERSTAAAEFDSVLMAVRARPELAEHLEPPSLDRLRAVVPDGPVVYVNVAEERCDALILHPDPDAPVQHVPLPRLTYRDAAERIPLFRAAHQVAVRDADEAVGSALHGDGSGDGLLAELAWLWDCAAEPVISALDYTGAPEPEPATSTGPAWPRIWWCPVGVATYLPLHAAGHHSEPSEDGAVPRTVLDRAVSTYTTTLRTLAYSRDRPAAAAAARALIVAMPKTQGAADLPGVTAEKHLLAELLPGATILEGSDATYESVRAALDLHDVAHFACHGLSDRADPARSRLLLFDHATRPLTVAALSDLNPVGPHLAYLSACSTSDTNPTMADEALHITSAFQLAGYHHVIGTLWPTGDLAAARIAEAVYRHLTNQGKHAPDVADTAIALHHAVRALRDQPSMTAASWASHIHVGGAQRTAH